MRPNTRKREHGAGSQGCQVSPIVGNTNWAGILSGQAVSPLVRPGWLDPSVLPRPPPPPCSKAGHHARRREGIEQRLHSQGARVKICRQRFNIVRIAERQETQYGWMTGRAERSGGRPYHTGYLVECPESGLGFCRAFSSRGRGAGGNGPASLNGQL